MSFAFRDTVLTSGYSSAGQRVLMVNARRIALAIAGYLSPNSGCRSFTGRPLRVRIASAAR